MTSLVEILKTVLAEDRRDSLMSLYVATKKVEQREFDRIYNADPSRQKKYVQWMLNKFIKEIKSKKENRQAYKLFFEDLYKITQGLDLFDRVKRKYLKQDINQYGLDEFKEESFRLSQTLGAEEKEKGKAKAEKYQELKLGTVEGFTVYKIPQGKEELKPVACDLGSGTNWCTSHNLSNYYNTYNKKDPLFIFIKGDEKYQYHIQSNQFMDKEDRSMQKGELKDAFLDFIEKVEGRISSKTKVEAYQIGEFEASGQTYPVYKVGDKFYSQYEGQNYFYDPDTKVFKYAKGDRVPAKYALSHPMADFLIYVYRKLTSGEKAQFPNIYKALFGLEANVELTAPLRSLDLTGGNAVVALPKNLKVLETLKLTGTNIKKLPSDLEVGGEIIDYKGNIIKNAN